MAGGIDDPYIPRFASFGHGEGNLGTLFDAFDSLKQGIKDFQLTNSVNAARDQIQQMTDNAASEAELNRTRNQLSYQLGTQMLSQGFPVSQTEEVRKLFTPVQTKPQYTNLAEIAAYGTPEQRQNALDFYSKYRPPKEVDETAQTLKNEAAQSRIDKIYDDRRTKLADKVDKAQASGRKLTGRLANVQAKLEEVKAGLLSDPAGALNKLTLPELATSLSSVFSGGVGTVSGTEHLLPNTLNQKLTDTKNYLQSGLKPYNIPEIAKGYSDIVDRLLTIVPAQQNEAAKATLRGELSLANKDENKFSNIAEAHIKNPDGTPDRAYVKNGRVRFTSDDKIDELKDGVKWAMQNAKKDPEKAAKIFSAVKESPFYMQALQADPTFSKVVIGAGRALRR